MLICWWTVPLIHPRHHTVTVFEVMRNKPAQSRPRSEPSVNLDVRLWFALSTKNAVEHFRSVSGQRADVKLRVCSPESV